MSPPRNGSLGRGLGDLLGGVPETIGVAGVPPQSVEIHADAKSPVAESVKERAGQGSGLVVEKPCLTPARLIMVFSLGLFLILIGAGFGMWAGLRPKKLPSVAAPVVFGTNTVALPPEPTPPEAVVDGADFDSLKAVGIRVKRESGGVVRMTFEAPLFSSRVILDPAQMPVLNQLGRVLARHSREWEAKVIGHTDSVPIRGSGLYRDNRELGLARATEVVRVLCRQAAVPASMMVAATAGDENPPFAGTDPEASRKNRTVTLVIRVLPE